MANIQEKVAPSGQHYSGANRIPNIKQFMESLDQDKAARDAEIEAQQKRKEEQQQEQQQQQKQKQHDRPRPATRPPGKHHKAYEPVSVGKNVRVVTDPVTGKDVEIADMDSKLLHAVQNPKLSIPNANLFKATTVKTEATQSGEEYRHKQDITAPPAPVAPGSTSDVPIHGEKTNVLFHPTPSVSYEPMFAALEARANTLCISIFFAIVVVGKLLGGRLLGLVPLAFCVVSGVFLWVKEVVRQGRDIEWSSEQKRGETAVVNLIPESVEWLNSALALVWGLINPDMFAGVADTLEDVMQASVPGVVENVKVNDISQGSNPIRVLSLRALPDSHVRDLAEGARLEGQKTKDAQEMAADEAGGEFYNLEATVAYHALPSGRDVASKARNMGMQLVFYLGIKGLFGVPFPVWVELNGLVCTVRLRVALAPDPPFVKTVTFTLMGLPKVDAGCIPLVEKGANVLNLPLISNFVNWAIAAAANMYVAPKSMTLDVGKMLQGDAIQKETTALGVLFIRIHKAVGLSKQDARGSKGGGSDPYICVAFSKFGKPQYCTRVIQDDLNPVFNESAALLVTADIIRVDEQLSLELWDSDRSSADDVVGKVELSIQQLIQHPGKMFPQVSSLRGVEADSTMPGELHWEVGFFGKTKFRRALRTDGKDPHIPKELQDRAELQEGHGVISTEEEEAVVRTPPDPLWPSGILSIVVHQIVGLELENVKGSVGKRKGRDYEPARPEAGELKEEQGKKLPSSYCTIIVNDELAYKTRTKVVSSKPIFEAGTERFVRDWRSTIATVTVRDARNREHDPILGVVPLKLCDVLLSSSQSTRWYPLDGGIGFGRVRVSVLFRSVELRLPPSQVGFGEVGTFEFLSDDIVATSYVPSPRVRMRLRTGGSSATVRGDRCHRTRAADGRVTGLRWDISRGGGGDEEEDMEEEGAALKKGSDHGVRLPVQYRYRSPVFFELHPVGRRGRAAYASVWLQDLADNEPVDFDLPLWRCDNPLRLSQNYVTEANYRTVPDLDLEEVGRLRFRGRFKPGTDREHLKFVSDNDSRETIETWEACYAEGVRSEVVHAEVPELVARLHEESLVQNRDVLASAPDGDKQKLVNGDKHQLVNGDGTAGQPGAVEREPAEMTNGAAVAVAASEGGGVGERAVEDGYYAGENHEVRDEGHEVREGEDHDHDRGEDEGEGNYVYAAVNTRDGQSSGGQRAGGVADQGTSEGAAAAAADAATPRAIAGMGPSTMVNGVDGVNGATKPGHSRTISAATGGTASSAGTDASGASGAASSASGGGGRKKSTSSGGSSSNPIKQYKAYKTRSRDLHRRHRGLMQWAPMRNMQFAKDEATFAVRRVLNVGKLNGRSPDVETEV